MPKAETTFDMSAVKGLQETLSGISEDVQADVLGTMVAEGAKPVVRSIKSKVHVRLGNLRDSIVYVVRKNKRRGTAIAVIGPEVGKKAADGSRPARYAHLVEFGHKARNASENYANRKTVAWTEAEIAAANQAGSSLPSAGRRLMVNVPAYPFMRPGTEAAKENCAAMMLVGFQKGLTKALRKHVRKISNA